MQLLNILSCRCLSADLLHPCWLVIQRQKHDLATNSSEKHFERKINYYCWIWGSNAWMWRVLSSAIYSPCSSAWCLLHASFLLKMEKTCSPETLVDFHQAAWHHIFACLQRNWTAVNTVKPPLKVSFGSSGFEHYTEENLKWRKFSSEIIDLG